MLFSRLDPLKADGIFVISGSGRCDKPSNLHLLKVRVEVTASRGASLYTEDPHANGSPRCTAYIHQLSASAYMTWGRILSRLTSG